MQGTVAAVELRKWGAPIGLRMGIMEKLIYTFIIFFVKTDVGWTYCGLESSWTFCWAIYDSNLLLFFFFQSQGTGLQMKT